MSAAERFKRLAEQYKAVDVAVRRKQDARQVETQARSIGEAAESLERGFNQVQVLRDGEVLGAGDVPGLPLEMCSAMHESVKDAVQGESVYDLPSNEHFRPWLASVKDWASLLETASSEGWNRHKQRVNASLPQENFLNVVASVSAKTVNRFRERRSRWENIGLPQNEEMMRSAATLRQQLEELALELNPDDWPQDVLDFLGHAQRDGARLDLFTDSVRTFLDEKGLLQNIRLRFI